MLKKFLVNLACRDFLLMFRGINVTDVTKTEISTLIIVWLQLYIRSLCELHSV